MRHDTHPERRTRDRERLTGGMTPARGVGAVGSYGPARGSDTVDAHGRFRIPALAGSTVAHHRDPTRAVRGTETGRSVSERKPNW